MVYNTLDNAKDVRIRELRIHRLVTGATPQRRNAIATILVVIVLGLVGPVSNALHKFKVHYPRLRMPLLTCIRLPTR